MLMKRRPFRAVLTELANRHPDIFVKKDGQVNASEMARALNVTQATISRALQRSSYQPKKDLIDAMCSYFDISAAQARGEDTLIGSPRRETVLSARAERFAARFDSLPAARKKLLESFLDELSPNTGHRQTG